MENKYEKYNEEDAAFFNEMEEFLKSLESKEKVEIEPTVIKTDGLIFHSSKQLGEYLRTLVGIQENLKELKEYGKATSEQLARIDEIDLIFKEKVCPCCGEHWWNE